jgi:hypothetical protein
MEVSGQLHAPAALLPEKSLENPLDEAGWAPKTGLEDVENRKFLTLPGLELRSLCLLDRSQSLYRLSYPAFFKSS